MTARRDHAAEMHFAIEHKCSLDEARRALARLRWRATQEAAAKAAEQPNEHGPEGLSPMARTTRRMMLGFVDQRYWWNRD